jgi:predicted nucleotidyltransferase
MIEPRLNLPPQSVGMVREILKREIPGVEVWVFGSRIQGRSRPFSDLDLALKGPSQIEPSTLTRLQMAFEDSNLPIFVDVLDLSEVSEAFRHRIEANHMVFPLTGDD